MLIPISQIKVLVKVFPTETGDSRQMAESKSQTIEINPCECTIGFHCVNGVCVRDDQPTDEKPSTILTKVLGGVAILGSIALLATRRR